MGALAFWCAGFGHGTCLPVALSSAPLSALVVLVFVGLGALLTNSSSEPGPAIMILEMVVLVVILGGAPLVWGAMAALTAAPRTPRKTRLFVGAILSHYLVGAIAIVLQGSEGWRYLDDTWRAVPAVLVGWALVYVGAHVLLWRSFLRSRKGV